MRPIRKIALISPSISLSGKPFNEERWRPYLQNLGLEITELPSALKGQRRYADAAKEKARDIMAAYEDNTIDALMCVNGGAGALKVLEYLDYDVISRNFKPIFGFSDSTSLQLAVYAKTGHPFVSGFLPAYEFSRPEGITPLVDESLQRVLHGQKVSFAGGKTVRAGEAEGILLGECLSTISDLSGTPYYPDLNGTILLLEDECEPAYKISLMLTQLRLNPSFGGVKGIVFGRFSECANHPTQGTMDEVLTEFCAQIKVPVMRDYNFGHFAERYVLPMGVRYKMDAATGVLTQVQEL